MKKLLALLLLAGCVVPPPDGEAFDAGLPITPVTPVTPAPVIVTVLPRGQWTKTSVVSDVTTPISLEVDKSTAFCTSLGYGGTNFLKVLIPQLDTLAHFDHRVEGTTLPCAAVGECTSETANILQNNPGFDAVDLRVVLTEKLMLDGDAKTCQRQLSEDVSTEVRGLPLHHHVDGALETLTLGDCTGR